MKWIWWQWRCTYRSTDWRANQFLRLRMAGSFPCSARATSTRNALHAIRHGHQLGRGSCRKRNEWLLITVTIATQLPSIYRWMICRHQVRRTIAVNSAGTQPLTAEFWTRNIQIWSRWVSHLIDHLPGKRQLWTNLLDCLPTWHRPLYALYLKIEL